MSSTSILECHGNCVTGLLGIYCCISLLNALTVLPSVIPILKTRKSVHSHCSFCHPGCLLPPRPVQAEKGSRTPSRKCSCQLVAGAGPGLSAGPRLQSGRRTQSSTAPGSVLSYPRNRISIESIEHKAPCFVISMKSCFFLGDCSLRRENNAAAYVCARLCCKGHAFPALFLIVFLLLLWF